MDSLLSDGMSLHNSESHCAVLGHIRLRKRRPISWRSLVAVKGVNSSSCSKRSGLKGKPLKVAVLGGSWSGLKS